MFEARNYPNTPEDVLVAYEHIDPDLPETMTSPFPVIVFGLDEQFLGFGRLLGRIDKVDGLEEEVEQEESDAVVIEIDDPSVEGGKVHLLGIECLWNVATPEVIEKYVEILDRAQSPKAYSRLLDLLVSTQHDQN